MPTFNIELRSYNFDEAGFNAATNERLKNIFLGAAKEFYKAAIARIPVRTGFVYGAFSALGEQLGIGAAKDSGIKLSEHLINYQKKIRDYQSKLVSVVKRSQLLRERVENLSKQAEKAKKSGRAGLAHASLLRRQANRLQEKQNKLFIAATNSHKKLERARKRFNIQRGKFLSQNAKSAFSSFREQLRGKTLGLAQNPSAHSGKNITTEDIGRSSILEHQGKGKKPLIHKITDEKISKNESVPSNKKEYYYGSGSKILKTLRSGRQFVAFGVGKNSDIKNVESIDKFFNGSTRVDGFLNFFFRIDIAYFNINDANANSRTASAPWGSVAAGRRAFLAYIDAQKARFPKVFDFMYETTYTLKGTSLSKSSRKLT